MTTSTTTSVIAHTSDATFRAWGLEISTMLDNVGFIKTADTGQVNWATVTRPGTSTDGGYEIRYLNDSLNGTAPVRVRIDYGTGATAATPRLRLTVGTASNGSGTISGLGRAVTEIGSTSGATSAVTNYTSRACMVDGFIGFMWKLGANTGNTILGSFFLARSVDSAGAPTAEGLTIMSGTGTPVVQLARFIVGDSIAMSTQSYCLVAGGPSSSLVSASAQVYKHYQNLPRVRPINQLLTVFSSEVGNNTQFDATPIGALSVNYISSGPQGLIGVALPGLGSAVCLAMRWE